ncbi:UNVERIFIED_CONTAM: hypothetical protein Sradi_2749300 [Sesamum radiatum]|uniref:ARM repeat superfamily protein n=1 Tax=Sesamum radiatum TaxID=300843 RepID=A0AAW2S802_SESRA
MDHKASSMESEGSVHLQISELNVKLSDAGSISPTIFEPRISSIDAKTSSATNAAGVIRPSVRAPEKKLTLFALRLAVLEKAASGIGTLGFIWATVVLLGGFAITLDRTDFWFITVILLIEGTRIFSRSHELEWQHQATWSITNVGINSFRAIKSSSNFIIKTVKAKMPTRTWTSSEVPLLPYAPWVFISRNVSKLLYWLQLASATACVVLSLIKLVHRNYGNIEKGDSDKRNRKSALIIFYSLALAEALLFLLEKAYWEWKLIGARILRKFSTSPRFSEDTLQKIGINLSVMERLVEMLNWKDSEEEEIRREAAEASNGYTVSDCDSETISAGSENAGQYLGDAGKQLRKEISEIVFTISYIRDILRHGEKQPELQILGIEILTSLAIEEDATERIGGTGGVLKVLFDIFLNDGIPENQSHVRKAAGEALAMLALESKNTCQRILKLRLNENLIRALEVPLLRVNAARILRNLCAYSGGDSFQQLKGLTAAAPTILEVIMKEENKMQEVMIGAASCIFKFMSSQDSGAMFRKAGIREFDLAHRLLLILKKYEYPSIKVPSIRRYAIELAIWMMRENNTNVRTFQTLGLEKELESVMETTSELESFNIFSGTVGLCRHRVEMHTLVETAMKLLEEDPCVPM